MSAESYLCGSRADLLPSRRDRSTPRAPLLLPSLLARPENSAFAQHASRDAPTDTSRLSLLLSVCGYVVRRAPALQIWGTTAAWLTVRMPQTAEPVRDFLLCVVELVWPARVMDADDERFDLVFADRRRALRDRRAPRDGARGDRRANPAAGTPAPCTCFVHPAEPGPSEPTRRSIVLVASAGAIAPRVASA